MLNRVCAVAKRTGAFSSSPSKSNQSVAFSRRFKKSYCTASNSNETLAESAAKNGGVAKYPSGFDKLDEPSESLQKLADQIMNISFYEAAQLTRLLQKRLGTSGMAMPMMSGGFAGGAPAAAAPAAAAPAEPEKPAEPVKPARVDLKLVSFPDANKFKVLKEIRNLKPGMNLMESKALIEGLPKVVMEGLLYKDAEEWKKALAEAGAEVEFA